MVNAGVVVCIFASVVAGSVIPVVTAAGVVVADVTGSNNPVVVTSVVSCWSLFSSVIDETTISAAGDHTRYLLNKNHVYKNVEAQISEKIRTN